MRYAIRPFCGDLKDAADVEEFEKTRFLTKLSPLSIIMTALRTAVRHPVGLVRALRCMWGLARRSPDRFFVHFAYLAEAMVLSFWCRRDGVSHLHVHFGTNSTTIATIAHALSAIKFSFTVHGPEEFDRPQELALCEKIRNADFVVAISSYGRSQLMRWVPPSEWRKIHVIHCGVDDQFLEDSPAFVSSEPRFICVARLSEQKGHLVLLEAVAHLKRAGFTFKLILVGDGPLRRLIETEIIRLGLVETVLLRGTQSQKEVREEILRARAMVLPSFAEGLPVVLMESLVLRRPVISTYVAGIPELVRSDNGWLIPAGDVPALEGAMREVLCASAQELSDKGEKGRRRALARHDVRQSVRLLESLMADTPECDEAFIISDDAVALEHVTQKIA